MKGLFDLTVMESAKDDDILNLSINEDVSVPVPGGDKENPNATIKDKNELSIPGGDKEAPGTAAIELSAEEYNSALSTLKKSFKEGYDIMELLEKAVVSTISVDDLQDEFTENAIFESYINGPYFEKVQKDDKLEIKKVVAALYDAASEISSIKYGYTPMKASGIFTVLKKWNLKGSRLNKAFKPYLFQMAGTFELKDLQDDDNDITSKARDYFVDLFKNELGSFTLNLLEVRNIESHVGVDSSGTVTTTSNRRPERKFVLLVGNKKAALKILDLKTDVVKEAAESEVPPEVNDKDKKEDKDKKDKDKDKEKDS